MTTYRARQSSSFSWSHHSRDTVVRDKLREAILHGHLRPGERLEQKEIAEHFKVSRSPVRAALISLAAEGLVYTEPHRGSIVAELSPAELEEIYEIREVLEGIAARQGAPNLSDQQLEQMAAIKDELDHATSATDRVRLNQEFHNILYGAGRRPRLYALIQMLSNTTLPYTHLHFNQPKHWEIANTGHHHILAAALRRNGAEAERATAEHIRAVCDSMLENWASSVQEEDKHG